MTIASEGRDNSCLIVGPWSHSYLVTEFHLRLSSLSNLQATCHFLSMYCMQAVRNIIPSTSDRISQIFKNPSKNMLENWFSFFRAL